MSYRDFINNLSVTPFGVWLVKTFAARVDPAIYKLTGGRYTSSGPLTIPQLTLTTIGRKSGKERTVQLGYTEDGDDVLIVASNFGGTNHPAWSYNLDANPSAKIRLGEGDPLAEDRPDDPADEDLRDEDGSKHQGLPAEQRLASVRQRRRFR